MDSRTLLQFMAVAEKLKCNTRHSWTSEGRHESVAEHTYRLMVFAWLVKEEFPDCDMDRVMKLCLFHDIGEAVTGDIPSFEKSEQDEQKEGEARSKIVEMLPAPYAAELTDVLREIEENITTEARLFHALDKLEAVIQHNEAPLDTWLPLEHELQLTYGQEQAEEFPYMKELREVLRQDSLEKMHRVFQL